MKRIYYSGGSLLTGDTIAEAVLAYAEALAKNPQADVVHVPVLVPDSDAKAVASLLIGPASQLMCVPEGSNGLVEPHDAAVIDDLVRRTLLVGSPRPIAQSVPDEPGSRADNEYE
jgi:alkanesulfonate monooxygenase SsuD/methylene tetrahydromethanopterin reductase-like flavin-dependent oxidoreductase (luciferase family)